MPPLLSDSESDSDTPQTTFKVNETYAARLEHNKKREELHRLESKYGKDIPLNGTQNDKEDEDSSTSESEDEVGELVTPQIDAEIWRTIAMIRERRPEVYDEKWTGFNDSGETVQKEKKEKPMYLKDYHRKNLLGELEDDEEPQEQQITTYAQEQEALKEAFHTTLTDSEEDDLIQPKKKSKGDKVTEEQEYQNFLASTLRDEASQKMLQELKTLVSQPSAPLDAETENGEAFLAKYLLNRGWLDPDAPIPELYEDPSSDEEKADEFETKYNFRFEQPGAAEVTTHARTISSTRRGDEKRKRERERKKAQKDEEKRKEKEEIARLRNLKRIELEERIKKVESIAGKHGWTEKDLEGDFDPEEWDRRMEGVFDESYYNEDAGKPVFDEDDIDISDLIPDAETEEPKIVETKLAKREKLDKKKKIEEILDETLPLDKPKSAFRYREVSPTTFGLEPIEILTASDAQLNEFVGLKKLAPYRPQEVKEGDIRKYGKKKRLREWRKRVKEEGEDEDIRAMLRPDKPQVEEAVDLTKEKSKKRKSRKGKGKDVKV